MLKLKYAYCNLIDFNSVIAFKVNIFSQSKLNVTYKTEADLERFVKWGFKVITAVSQ